MSQPFHLELQTMPKDLQEGIAWEWSLVPQDASLDSPIALRWRWIPPKIPPKSFRMGARGYESDEEPNYEVNVPHGYWMMETPVTQLQWVAVSGGENPSNHRPANDWKNLPVERVSWKMAKEWCEKVTHEFTRLSGNGMLRLPTEAEWEYACRAGKDWEYGLGDGEGKLKKMGWYDGNSRGRTHPVGLKEANGWGLKDMHGNVWEWCLDGYESYEGREDGWLSDRVALGNGADPLRVMGGGSYGDPAVQCRSACRCRRRADRGGDDNGFRACLWLGPLKNEKQ